MGVVGGEPLARAAKYEGTDVGPGAANKESTLTFNQVLSRD